MKSRFSIVPLAALALLFVLGAPAVPAASSQAPRRASSRAAAQAPATPLDVNTASAADLESVPGIGRALAQRIVVFREKNGAFERVDDLLKVQGIGEKSLAKLRPYLTAGKAK